MKQATPGRDMMLVLGTLIASSGTLVCCVLPALFVAAGAGAALAALVSAVPQLIWLSEHKGGVFILATLFLVGSGVNLWKGRRAPCPADPSLARACQAMRRASAIVYSVALVVFLVGASFAFLLPLLA